MLAHLLCMAVANATLDPGLLTVQAGDTVVPWPDTQKKLYAYMYHVRVVAKIEFVLLAG